jgi:hypothetical protein
MGMVDRAVKERVKWIISGLEFDDLNEWEQKFVESVENRVDSGLEPTDKQMEKLEEIYKEKGR